MDKTERENHKDKPERTGHMGNQRQLLLGVFFVVALSILAFYTLFLTDIHLFSKPILMTVYFEEANNLREGDQVQLLGARIGRVKEVRPNTSAEKAKRIRTVLSLERVVELLEDSVISIQETSLLGGRNVMIDPGTFGGRARPALEDGGYLGVVQKNPIAAFGDFGTEISKLVSENRGAIGSFIKNLDAVMADIKDGKGLLGRLVSDDTLSTDVKQGVADLKTTIANAREASEQLKNGQGLVGALLYDQTFKQKASDTLDNIQKLSTDLRSQQGVLGSLIYDTAMRDRITKGIDSFVAFGEKLNEGQGTLSLLMNDTATREQVKTLVANLSSASEDLKSVVADVKNGQGTLGKLMQDGGLYDDIRKAVGVLTRSLEDYREAAPISAFTSVLFAAF